MNKDYTIIQFETDDFYQTTLDIVFEWIKLKPAVKVSNRDELKNIISKIEKKQIVPDVAIIDSYIGIDSNDGSKIASKLKELCPGIKIIGYSIMESNEWADVEIIKSNRDQTKTLLKGLEEALGVEFNFTADADPEQDKN